MVKEHGICTVSETDLRWGKNTVGTVIFKEKYDVPPEIQLTTSEENRPEGWAMIVCSILELTTDHLVIDFDGWKFEAGEFKFSQEVYPGAKCHWIAVGD